MKYLPHSRVLALGEFIFSEDSALLSRFARPTSLRIVHRPRSLHLCISANPANSAFSFLHRFRHRSTKHRVPSL